MLTEPLGMMDKIPTEPGFPLLLLTFIMWVVLMLAGLQWWHCNLKRDRKKRHKARETSIRKKKQPTLAGR